MPPLPANFQKAGEPMANKLLTDVELRANWSLHHQEDYAVEEGTILTPAAVDFLREHNIRLRYVVPERPGASMTRTPIPVRNGKACYVYAATGRELHEKPEEMTHLRGNQLVPKMHPRIAFRGKLDSLMAQLMEVEVMAAEAGEEQILTDLEELLSCIRQILAAEVKDVPLKELRLLGLDSAGIRRHSHLVKETLGIDHPIPDYRMGRLCVALNALRTQVRETELSAVRAFTESDGQCTRKDIVEELNRLSSCVYIIFCRKLAGYYGGGDAT